VLAEVAFGRDLVGRRQRRRAGVWRRGSRPPAPILHAQTLTTSSGGCRVWRGHGAAVRPSQRAFLEARCTTAAPGALAHGGGSAARRRPLRHGGRRAASTAAARRLRTTASLHPRPRRPTLPSPRLGLGVPGRCLRPPARRASCPPDARRADATRGPPATGLWTVAASRRPPRGGGAKPPARKGAAPAAAGGHRGSAGGAAPRCPRSLRPRAGRGAPPPAAPRAGWLDVASLRRGSAGRRTSP